jgi:hypothetical protein
MIFLKSNKRLRKLAVKKAQYVLDTQMPKNTNYYSFAARQQIAEIIINMIFKDFSIESKLKERLRRLRTKKAK